MEKSFRQLLKEYFHFSKKDRRGIIALSALIFLVIVLVIVVDGLQFKADSDFSEFKKALQAWEEENSTEIQQHSLFSFNPNTISEQRIDSLQLPRFVKNNILNYRKAGGKFDSLKDVRKIYGMTDSIFAAIEKYIIIPEPEIKAKRLHVKESDDSKPASIQISGVLDPNKADSLQLSEFGLNAFQASNLIKYRQSGGYFSKPADLLKIYGIDSAFYLLIKNNILIEPEKQITANAPEGIVNGQEIRIELNTADSLDLIKLPGIGSVFASRIIKYRQLLGGYCSVDQLLEVYHFPEETYHKIYQNISVDPGHILPIRLNFAGYGELLRHPYIEKEEVEAILGYRNKNGPFRTLKEFEDAGIVDAEKVKQLRNYLTCR
ncbi:MAG: helix-hairpin-helix domain-containing protein [Tangfeifania sp.]